MSFITAKNLTRRYDLSDPWIVRQLTFRPKRFLTAVNDVSFSVEKGRSPKVRPRSPQVTTFIGLP